MFTACRVSSLFLGVMLGVFLFAAPLDARVTRVEVSRRADVLGGRAFGDAGAYERITGKIYFSVAVTNPHNQRIVDLANAVNLKNGEVEFSADLVAVRPKDPRKGNGSLLLEVPNRGRARILSLVDGGDQDLEKDAGDAWLLRRGFTVVSLGWQWDAAGDDALRLYAPVAKENGKTIMGLLRGDLMPSKPMAEISLGHLILGMMGGSEYPVAAPNDPRNVLTVRDSREAPRTVIPRSEWQFAHTVDGKVVASDRHIHLNAGFQPGKIYEYVYVVADPVVAGVGLAAIRDFASYVKHAPDGVTPAQRVYGEGISQNGRFLREMIYQGFDTDEEGRLALDGVLAHVAGAGRGSFNYRFAQPSRDAQPTSSVSFPTDIFPFTDEPEKDPVTGETCGLLDRATADKALPKIFFSNTSYEYWGRVAALIHVSADGRRDAAISDHVRIYHFTGLQHFSGPFPPQKGSGDLLGQEPQSPLPIRYFWRAMIANMDAWVRDDRPPPASSYPKLSDGTLVPLREYAFPAIPGVNKPTEANAAYHLDFGPEMKNRILSTQPPKVGEAFPVLVPQVDADGNERDGVRLPEFAAPLATYTGWNLRDASIGAPDQRVSFEGSYIAFPKTAADREKMGDPRKSIAERYANREEYLSKYKSALDDLVKQRWILEEDRPAVLERGEQEWTEAMSPPIGQVGEAGAAVVADKIEIPNYPPLALQAGISAKIILQVEVKKSGEVNSVRLISAQTDRGYGTAGFVDTATAAAKTSRFSCPTCKGLSFEHVVTYDFQYPPVPEHVCTPKPKETIPPPPSTTDAPGHVTVRPSKWSCVQI
jgi:TonB family protein